MFINVAYDFYAFKNIKINNSILRKKRYLKFSQTIFFNFIFLNQTKMMYFNYHHYSKLKFIFLSLVYACDVHNFFMRKPSVSDQWYFHLSRRGIRVRSHFPYEVCNNDFAKSGTFDNTHANSHWWKTIQVQSVQQGLWYSTLKWHMRVTPAAKRLRKSLCPIQYLFKIK